MDALTLKDSEKFLRQISKNVDFSDPELKQNIEDLKQFCREHSCFAMAAVQIGIPKRIVFVKSTSTESAQGEVVSQMLLINPKITQKCGRTEYWEACVSGLDNCALVERPYSITVEYQDENGQSNVQTFEGFAATVLSHELDHLEGIFHMDRAKKLLYIPAEERKKLRETQPYIIHSKTCEFEYKKI